MRSRKNQLSEQHWINLVKTLTEIELELNPSLTYSEAVKLAAIKYRKENHLVPKTPGYASFNCGVTAYKKLIKDQLNTKKLTVKTQNNNSEVIDNKEDIEEVRIFDRNPFENLLKKNRYKEE